MESVVILDYGPERNTLCFSSDYIDKRRNPRV